MTNKYQYETIKVDLLPDGVAHAQLNRPKKLNTLNPQYVFDTIKKAWIFTYI